MTKAKQRSKFATTTHRVAPTKGGQKGNTTMQTQHVSKSGKNGNAPKATDEAPELTTAVDTTTPEGEPTDPDARPAWRARGIMPTMPHAVFYKHGGKVVAAIHHPAPVAGDRTSLVESGRGLGSAKGGLEDMGFAFSATFNPGPEWLTALVPASAEIIGYASIKGFPLPK